VNELATVLAPMAEKAQSEALESQVDINLPDIERSVSEITNALAPMAKEIQLSEQPLESQVKLNVPEIERSVSELVAVLVPTSQNTSTSSEVTTKKRMQVTEIERSVTDPSAGLIPMSQDNTSSRKILENQPSLELNVPEIERSISELSTALTSFDSDIGKKSQPSEEISDSKTQVVEVPNQVHEEERDEKEENQKVTKTKLVDQTHPYELPSLPTNPCAFAKDILPLSGRAIISLEESPVLVDPLSELPQLPCVDSRTATPSPQHETPKTIDTEKFASLPFLTKSSRTPIVGTLKSDTKNGSDGGEVKASTPSEQKPEEETAEKVDAPATASSSLIENSHAAPTDIKYKEVVLRALKEDLVKAYKAVLKVEGGGISDEKLGSLLLWLGIPEVSVNKHVRRILKRKRKSGKPSRQTNLKNILRYLTYVFA
jgi:hypothetical protein